MDRILGKRMIPQFSTREHCYLSQNNLVLKYSYTDQTFEKVCSVVIDGKSLSHFVKENILRNYLYRNFLSNDFGLHHVCVMPSSHLIALYGGLYRFDLSDEFRPAQRVVEYDRLGFDSPLKSGIAVHEKTGNFYFGEYINGKKRNIRICRVSNRGKNVDIVYDFPKNSMQHIHGIFYDRFRNRLWITSGDRDHECVIHYTDNEFETLKELGGGDQSWRAVSVIPTENHLVWGSDAGKDAPVDAINKVYTYDLKTGQRSEVAVIGNPAYHSARSSSGKIYLGVNFESGRKQDTPEEAALWRGDSNSLESWNAIRSFPFTPGKVHSCSKYGYVYLPSGEVPDNYLVYAALNVSNRQFASYIVEL